MAQDTGGDRERSEKVVVFLDNSELYRALHLLKVSSKLDYRLLKEHLVCRREASQLRFYCGELQGDSQSRQGFYKVLRNVGFEIFAGHRYGTHNVVNAALDEPLQRWIHCQITYDMACLLEWGNFDTFILVSGAPEYAGVVEQIRRRGIDVEVAFFRDACSRDLRESASKFHEIDLSICSMSNCEPQRIVRGDRRDSATDQCLPAN